MFFTARNFNLRNATAADCDSLWEWRNSKDVSQWMSRTEAIPYEDHCKWFANRHDLGFSVFILDFQQQPIGVITFREGATADILVPTMYLVPARLNSGLGLALEWFMLKRAFAFETCDIVAGEAYPDNPVMKLHAYFQFSTETLNDQLLKVWITREKYHEIKDEKFQELFKH